jgi:hypothetical protein
MGLQRLTAPSGITDPHLRLCRGTDTPTSAIIGKGSGSERPGRPPYHSPGLTPHRLPRRYSGPDDVGHLHHDHVTEDLVSEHDLGKHQDIGVASARIAEPMDLKC